MADRLASILCLLRVLVVVLLLLLLWALIRRADLGEEDFN